MEIHSINLKDAQALNAFIDLPWQIYPDNYPWIPPLKTSILGELSDQNLFFRHGEAQAFICKEGDTLLGRIMASVDANLSTPEIGHFGYFECFDNLQAAKHLFEAAENWLQKKGKTEVHGPINLNIYHPYRLQTAGFDTQPFLGEPRHPSYYQKLLAHAGYQTHATWNSWDISSTKLQLMQQAMENAYSHLKEHCSVDYSLRILDIENFETDMRLAHEIIMDVYKENYGFSQLDAPEFIQMHQGLKPIFAMNPDLAVFGYAQDQAVSFGFGYPDYGSCFLEMNGEIEKWPSAFSSNLPDTMVFLNFGVLKAHRKTHLAYQIYRYGLKRIQEKGIQKAIGALAKEGKTAYDKLGAPSRSYSIFEKPLG